MCTEATDRMTVCTDRMCTDRMINLVDYLGIVEIRFPFVFLPGNRPACMLHVHCNSRLRIVFPATGTAATSAKRCGGGGGRRAPTTSAPAPALWSFSSRPPVSNGSMAAATAPRADATAKQTSGTAASDAAKKPATTGPSRPTRLRIVATKACAYEGALSFVTKICSSNGEFYIK
jgi:hypothetical protein